MNRDQSLMNISNTLVKIQGQLERLIRAIETIAEQQQGRGSS